MGDELRDRLLVEEYAEELNRRGRIQAKTAGFLAIELIEALVALTATALAFAVGGAKAGKTGTFLLGVTALGILNFFVWSAVLYAKQYRSNLVSLAEPGGE